MTYRERLMLYFCFGVAVAVVVWSWMLVIVWFFR